MTRLRREVVAAAATLVLAACAGRPHPAALVPVAPAITVSPATAPPSIRPVAAAPLATRDGYAATDLGPALAAFRATCSSLATRRDASGLTQPGDWTLPCAAAATATDPSQFFASALVAVTIGDGRGLDTGYFEPDLAASATRSAGYTVPIYGRPADLVDLDLGSFDPTLAGKHIRGRVAGGTLVPYYDRAAVDAGALAGRGLELAWAADPYAAFFLEIQGSGRLRLTDGTTLRVGYAGQNGHAYTGIGKLLRDRGALGPGQATMAGIIGWLRAHPAEVPDVLHANRSKVFFKPLTIPPGQGPLGALGVPLTARVSVAADPAFVSLGIPLWLDTTVAGAPFHTVVVVQDTGGAIRGANRLDLFWGSGDAAGAVAGGITATGTVTVLLPPAAADRFGVADVRRAAPPRP